MTSSNLVIFTDGGSRGNPGPAGIGIHVEKNGETLFEKSAFIGTGTNNIAEYEAIKQALQWLLSYLSPTSGHRSQDVQCFLDSQLVVEQLSGRYKIKQPHILKYVQEIRVIIEQCRVKVKFTHIPREKNKRADALVNQALDAELSSK